MAWRSHAAGVAVFLGPIEGAGELARYVARRAYDADGMTTREFDEFGPTARTLRSFIGSYRDLLAVVRDFMLPNPDVKK